MEMTTVIMLIILEYTSAKQCGDDILKYMDMGDVLCVEQPSLAPSVSIIPKPRPVKK